MAFPVREARAMSFPVNLHKALLISFLNFLLRHVYMTLLMAEFRVTKKVLAWATSKNHSGGSTVLLTVIIMYQILTNASGMLQMRNVMTTPAKTPAWRHLYKVRSSRKIDSQTLFSRE